MKLKAKKIFRMPHEILGPILNLGSSFNLNVYQLPPLKSMPKSLGPPLKLKDNTM